ARDWSSHRELGQERSARGLPSCLLAPFHAADPRGRVRCLEFLRAPGRPGGAFTYRRDPGTCGGKRPTRPGGRSTGLGASDALVVVGTGPSAPGRRTTTCRRPPRRGRRMTERGCAVQGTPLMRHTRIPPSRVSIPHTVYRVE